MRRKAIPMKPGRPLFMERFEKRVWQLGPCDWRWELRHVKTGGGHPSRTTPIASGWASGPADANRKIAAEIEAIEKRTAAKWKAVPVNG